MIAVIVEFQLKPDMVIPFEEAMREQARSSLVLEEGCHYFDVCQDPETPTNFFLYELYSDKAAFDFHLQSPHFGTFDETVTPWIMDKKVQIFDRLEPLENSKE